MIIRIKNNTFKIRNCKDDDYRLVYNLLKRNMYSLFVKHWGRWNPNVFRDDYHKKDIKIVESGARIVAFYDFEFKEKFSYLNNIQIVKSIQGKGLGTFLMDLMEKKIKKNKLKKIRLKVFKDNLARKFYFRIGYKQIKDEGSSSILEKKV